MNIFLQVAKKPEVNPSKCVMPQDGIKLDLKMPIFSLKKEIKLLADTQKSRLNL
jgi:hypothetical protein